MQLPYHSPLIALPSPALIVQPLLEILKLTHRGKPADQKNKRLTGSDRSILARFIKERVVVSLHVG